MALHFASLGAKVFVIGRREEPLKETCEEIRKAGGTAAYATCDVRDFAAVEAAADKADAEFGRIDTVINNAAGNFMARTEKLSPNAFDTVVSIVLNGSFHCTQAFARKWIAQKKSGNVLSVTTTYAAANCGSGFVVPSSCAKAGVLAMTTSLAVEWAPFGIRVNAIAPGYMLTPPLEEFRKEDPDRWKFWMSRVPLGRVGVPDDLLGAAVFLSSDASSYMTGATLVIDGGYTCL